MEILVAPDKFRGTLSAAAAADAISVTLEAAGHTVRRLPLADGGEGTLEVLGGANRTTVVDGPLGDPVEAPWRLSRRTAVIEMALASGLALVGGSEHNDPVAASTYGTGELIAAAAEAGARRIVVGVGGSATTDGGLGALRAMLPLHRFRRVDMSVACDVSIGFVAAATVFAPQKGATPAQVALLERRLERLVQVYDEEYGVAVDELEGAGAAGGLAGGLACAGARLVSGFELVAEHLELDAAIEHADLVITGEGHLDEESFDGKVVGGVAALAASFGTPAAAVVGDRDDLDADLLGSLDVISLVECCGRDRAVGDTVAAVAEAVEVLMARAGGQSPDGADG